MRKLEQQLRETVRLHLAGRPARPPEAGRHLWHAFTALSATRTYSSAGPNPIQPSEILARCQLMRLPLRPRHVEIILAMDAALLEHAYAGTAAPGGVKTLPPISQQPLTAVLLDAVMG